MEGSVAGDTAHSARGKTITVLARVWITPPPMAAALHERAAEAFAIASPDQRLGVHWAMLTAAYPFFADVAAHVGRLLALQGEVQTAQLQRRIVTTWGDRSTIPRALQRTLRSMADWGALADGSARGRFLPSGRMAPVSAETRNLLKQGVVIAQESNGLGAESGLFPFARH